jgi:hypothetical protein
VPVREFNALPGAAWHRRVQTPLREFKWKSAGAAFLLLVIAVATPGLAGAADARPQAGWAQVDITPPLGIALGGRGGPDTLANHVLDPLVAQVLFLKDAKGAGLALVSLDVIGLPHALSERLRVALVHELGVEWNLVLLNTSHTHSGPYMLRELMAGIGPAPQIESDYFDTLAEKIIGAARQARGKLQPVEVESFRGTSQVAINRRGRNRDGNVAMLPNPDGPINDEVWVLRLSPADGGAPALVFAYACHPVIVYSHAPAAISADFPGMARNALRERHGAAHAQFLQGAAGNVRPRVLADLGQRRFRAARPDDARQAGEQLAEDVAAALKHGGQRLNLDLAGAGDRPFLPRDQPPARAVYEKFSAAGGRNFRRDGADYWLRRYDAGEGFAKGDAWPVGLVRLARGEWICHFAGEPCVEWVTKVRGWLGECNVLVLGYSQEGLTYLPTESLLPEGGYEVDECNRFRAHSPARLAPGIEAAVRQSLQRQLAFIRAEVAR